MAPFVKSLTHRWWLDDTGHRVRSFVEVTIRMWGETKISLCHMGLQCPKNFQRPGEGHWVCLQHDTVIVPNGCEVKGAG